MLRRIMELQVKAERGTATDADLAELARLDTAWHNAAIDPSECPSRNVA